VAQGEARARGYQQILWLFGEEGSITEAGGSNFFVLWRTEEGRRELVTAPLGDGTILEGVTRASVLELARERLSGDAFTVVERKFTMQEVVQAARDGRLEEGFACGTAFFVSPIGEIHFRGKDVHFPMVGVEGDEETSVAMRLRTWLKEIMYGRCDHKWGSVVEEHNAC
jgi:branched-chain amino acid aminotransferase